MPPRTLRADIPEKVERAILAALAKEPGQRPTGATTFAELVSR